MTAPLYLTDRGDLDDLSVGDEAALPPIEAHHAVAVRRTRVGEPISLTDGAGRLVKGRVTQAGPSTLRLVVEVIEDHPVPSPRFVLVQALAKNGRDEQAIEVATELGVDEIVPWQAHRSIVQWRGDRGVKAWRKWEHVLVAATKQSRRPRRPVLGEVVSTAELAARVRSSERTYLLHEEASTALAASTLPLTGDVVIIVGPEGGISDDEVDVLVAAGAQAVRLGSSVLRSSSAGPAALAVLNAFERWR